MLAGDVLEVFAATRRGQVQAVLPLCRGHGFGARWRMAGAREVFEPADVLYGDSAVVPVLARALARLSRPVALDRVPADSPLVPALRQAMRGRGLLSVRPAVPCPTIALDDSWAQPEMRFNAGRRSDFRRAGRKAAALGMVRYEVLQPDASQFDALFDEALQVELGSWKREAGTAIASEPAKEAFFRAYFRSAAAKGDLRIAFLRINGRAAAMQLAVEQGGAYWLFKIGYDAAYQACSPGTLLMLHTIGYAAGKGLRAYELLGGVEPWIAQLWTREAHPTLRLRTYPFNLRGMLAMAVDGAVWGWARFRRGRA
jgi:CelD/BcsL family acetyltransferase involved in cellulose biosynthesis